MTDIQLNSQQYIVIIGTLLSVQILFILYV